MEKGTAFPRDQLRKPSERFSFGQTDNVFNPFAIVFNYPSYQLSPSVPINSVRNPIPELNKLKYS
jgi:hypothetical protein